MAAQKTLLLLQLSLLIACISTTVATLQLPLPPSPAPSPHHPPHHHHHHHHHPPTPAPTPGPVKPPHKPLVPVHPPTKAPVPVHPPMPPTKAPVHPPTPLPVRKLLAIRGVVYCKSCKHKGVDTIMGATPLFKAVVKLQCNNTKKGFAETAETDKNGFFVFRPTKVTTMAFHKCKVFLVSSNKYCSVLTNYHGGVTGAALIPDRKKPVAASLYQYFNVGPLAFEPSKKCY